MFEKVNSVTEEINKVIETVSKLIGLESDFADVILRHINWNKEALVQCFYLKGKGFLLQQAGLEKFNSKEFESRISEIGRRSYYAASVESASLCSACGCRRQWFALNCDHWYCSNCYMDHFQSSVGIVGRQVLWVCILCSVNFIFDQAKCCNGECNHVFTNKALQKVLALMERDDLYCAYEVGILKNYVDTKLVRILYIEYFIVFYRSPKRNKNLPQSKAKKIVQVI